jgi:hypothetical protein
MGRQPNGNASHHKVKRGLFTTVTCPYRGLSNHIIFGQFFFCSKPLFLIDSLLSFTLFVSGFQVLKNTRLTTVIVKMHIHPDLTFTLHSKEKITCRKVIVGPNYSQPPTTPRPMNIPSSPPSHSRWQLGTTRSEK